MKKLISILTAGALAAGTLFCDAAGTDSEIFPRTISVSGTGTAVLKNDVAVLNFAVAVRDESAVKAAAENAKIMTKVFEALKRTGVPAEKISTAGYNIRREYSHSKSSFASSAKDVFCVRNSLRAVVGDAKRSGEIIDALAEAGVNEFSNLEFFASDTREAERKARAEAVKNARAAAEEMAEAAGTKVGKIISIKQTTPASASPRGQLFGYRNAASAFDAETPVSSGTSEINVEVVCVYELE